MLYILNTEYVYKVMRCDYIAKANWNITELDLSKTILKLENSRVRTEGIKQLSKSRWINFRVLLLGNEKLNKIII